MQKVSILIFTLLLLACRKDPNPAELVLGTWRLNAAELHIENMDSREWSSYIYIQR